MPLTLYKMDASPPVRAVYMAIEALKIPDVKYVEVDLLENEHLTEEYLKMNPQHTIPLLTDGNLNIGDSHAIITYLANKYAPGSPLYPTEPEKRALVDLKLHFDCGILYPAFKSVDWPVFFANVTTVPQEGLNNFKEVYGFTEKHLENSKWLAGNELTLADLSCVATISTMNEILPIDEKLYPKITSWLKRMSEFDFYKKGNVAGLEEYGKLWKMYLSR